MATRIDLCERCLTWRPSEMGACVCGYWSAEQIKAVREMNLAERSIDTQREANECHADAERHYGACCRRSCPVCCRASHHVEKLSDLYLRTAMEQVALKLKEILKREGACGSN